MIFLLGNNKIDKKQEFLALHFAQSRSKEIWWCSIFLFLNVPNQNFSKIAIIFPTQNNSRYFLFKKKLRFLRLSCKIHIFHYPFTINKKYISILNLLCML